MAEKLNFTTRAATLELRALNDKIYLNFWDAISGRDVCCEVIGERLVRIEYDDDGNIKRETDITLEAFVRTVLEEVR